MASVTPSDNTSQAPDDCTICLTSLTSGTPLLTLSCNHKFHFQCLALNIQARNKECPLCRAAIDEPVVQLLGNASQLSTQVQQTSQPPATQVPTNTVNATVPVIVIPSVEDEIDEAAALAISERFRAARQAAASSLNEADSLPLITAVTTLEHDAQVLHEESNIYGLITLEASPVLQSETQQIMQSRAPIDLVCIVDKSGSMGGGKITLLKKTLIDIVNQLGELDRLAIVSFSTDATDLSHGLKRMNPENQQVLKTEIDTITSGGGTYIGAGLQMGIDLVTHRQTKNPLAALLVLTDGQDNDQHDYTQIMSTLPEGVQCYTFGYGPDHQAELLVKLAEQGNDGTFTYIDEERAVSTAFSMTMAGLLTCTAQNIQVNIEFNDGYQITHFHSQYKYEPEQLPSTKLIVKLPNINADEKRNLVFQLHVPKVNDDQNVEMASQQSMSQDETPSEQHVFEKQTIGHVTISYNDPNTTHSTTTAPVAFHLIRAANLPAELLHVNHRLDRQRNRIETTLALERAIKERDYKASRAILAAQVEKLKASASAQDPFCQALIQDLQYSFPSEQQYRSTNCNTYRCHATERGTYMPATTSSSNRYHNRRQQKLIERYKRSSSP